MIDDKFEFIEILGSGHFGIVWHVVDKALGVDRALKIINPSKVLDKENFFHEAQILKRVEHKNIVKVEEAGTLDNDDVYVAMEYLEKGSVETEAKGRYVDLTRTRRIMIDVLRGLEHVHEMGIIHRDIKPGNIIIGPCQEGKLSDFGQAIPYGFNIDSIGVKDYAYLQHLAPEIYLGADYSIASDIYACGVTLYRLVNGDIFTPSLPPTKLMAAITSGKYPDRSRYREFVPRRLRNIIAKAIDVNPHIRYKSANKLRRAIEQLDMRINWCESKINKGMKWSYGPIGKYYEVIRRAASDGSYIVETRKGCSKSKARRVTMHCHYGLDLNRAQRITEKILQDFVTGKAA